MAMSKSEHGDTGGGAKVPEHQENAKTKRILIVEDDRLSMTLLSDFFKISSTRACPMGGARQILAVLSPEAVTTRLPVGSNAAARDVAGLARRAAHRSQGFEGAIGPCPGDDMISWPVSPRVGNVKNNDPSLIQAAAPW
jgi:hypothetical protein